MNRRRFLASLTALLGFAFAKIKAPAKSTHSYIVGCDLAEPGADHLAATFKGVLAPDKSINPWPLAEWRHNPDGQIQVSHSHTSALNHWLNSKP